MYQNIELGLPQQRVDFSINRLFGLHLPRGWSNRMKAVVAGSHRSTYDKILKRLRSGWLVRNADEMSVSVRGASCYVWALASLQEVAYIYTPTREGDTIQALLEDFSGVLGSDFYCGLRLYKLSPTEVPDRFNPGPERSNPKSPLRRRTQATG